MQCEQFEQRVNQLLDARQSLEDEPLMSHAANCEECRASWIAYQQMMGLLPISSVAPLPRHGVWTRRFAAVAAAVVLLIAFVNWPRAKREIEIQQISSTSPSNIKPSTDVVHTPGAPPYLVHQPLVSLRLLSMGDWTQTMNQVELSFGAELPDVQTEWMSAVATSMSPLQDSLTTTLNLIRRSVTPTSAKDTAS